MGSGGEREEEEGAGTGAGVATGAANGGGEGSARPLGFPSGGCESPRPSNPELGLL